MRVVILTSSRKGTASYCLPLLLKLNKIEVAMVIYNEGLVAGKWKKYRRIIKKTWRIGVFGAINGVRMRNWYNQSKAQHLHLQDIEIICRENNVPFQKTPAINSPRTHELMLSCNADVGVSLGNGYIGTKIFSVPRYGMLNIHGEVLPQFQNAQSVIWQLYENSCETGYTIHKIDKKIDTGDIVMQERFPIIFNDTLAGTVSATAAEILRRAGAGLTTVLNDFERYYRQAKPQGEGKKYTTPSLRQFLRISRNFKKLKQQAFKSK